MSVSFVIPAFNAESTLADTLESLRAQSTQHWSAIVVDDGSTDGTAQLARGFDDDRITVISKANRGLAGARNAGLSAMIGSGASDLVCFLDADDRVTPDFIETMHDAIGDADLVAAAYRMVGSDLEDLDWTIVPSSHDLALDRLIHVNPLAVGAVLVRVSSMRRLQVLTGNDTLFDESLPAAEDWDLWIRAGFAGADWAPIVQRPMFDYRLREGAMTGAIRTMHEAGCRVIGQARVPDRSRAMRGWSIRNAARAIAAADSGLAHELFDPIAPLRDDDLGILIGALRHAFMFGRRVGPAQADELWPTWQSEIISWLPDLPVLADICDRLDTGPRQFRAVADSLIEELAGRSQLVVYGMGRNGRALLDAIHKARPGLAIAWIDDHVDAPSQDDSTRLEPHQLLKSHLVIVTPDNASAILESLRDCPARVETISSLAAHQSA